MRIVNLMLLTAALLLAACAPGTVAQPATTEPETPIETNEIAPTPTNTSVPTVMPTVEVSSETSGAPESPASTAITGTDTATATIADTTTTTDTASLPEALPMSASASQSESAYDNRISPVDLLSSYFNAVNRQEYERAYGYWQQPPNDYDSFAAGYADTASVQLIVQPPTRIEGAAGSLYVEIPTVLIAHHHDGSMHTFAGCMVTRKSNLQPPDIPEEDVWHLYQARIAEVENNEAIPALLAQGCAT